MSIPGQFFEERALLVRKLCGETHLGTRIEVAATFTAQVGHTFPCQAEQAAVLRLRWNSQHQFASIGRWNGYLATQHHRDKVNIHVNIEIVCFALKLRVRFDADDQVKIPAWSTTDAWLSFASDANLRAVIYTSIYFDLDAFIARYHALTAAVCTWLIIDLASSFTDGADLCRLDIEGAHSSGVRFLERHLNGLFDTITGTASQIFARATHTGSSAGSSRARTPKKRLKEVGKSGAASIKIIGI